MEGTIYLRTFTADELVLDEQETRQALKFFFPADSANIDAMAVTDNTRNFAQGLLVAGIDASYTMGYVDALVSSLFRSGPHAGKLIKGFGKKAAKHWFKHARASDLMDAEIYETVRVEISRRFRTDLFAMRARGGRHEVRSAIAFCPSFTSGRHS